MPSHSLQVRRIDGPRWDQHATRFVDVFNEQTHCFNAARWGAGRVECSVLMAQDTVVAGAVVIVFTVPLLQRALAILKWGPVWRGLDTPDDPALLRAALTALRSHYCGERGHYFTVMPPADPGYESAWIDTLEALRFSPERTIPFPDRYFVNLAQSAEALRTNLHHKWRYNLKKAHANALEVRLCEAHEGLDAFMRLYRQMHARK